MNTEATHEESNQFIPMHSSFHRTEHYVPFPKLAGRPSTGVLCDATKSTFPQPTHTMTEFFNRTIEPTIELSPTIDTVLDALGVGLSKSCNVEGGNTTANGITAIRGDARISTLLDDWPLSSSDGRDVMVV